MKSSIVCRQLHNAANYNALAQPVFQRKRCTVTAFFKPANDGGTAASRNDLAVVLQPVLEQLKQLNAKVEKLDAKVDNQDAKVEKLDAKVDNLDAKVEKLDAKVEKLDAKVDNLSADVQQLKLDVEVLRAATDNNAQLLKKDLELLKKDMRFYVLVCLVAIPILSMGLPAVLPFLVKTLP